MRLVLADWMALTAARSFKHCLRMRQVVSHLDDEAYFF
jgi:hypothetical protein